MKAGQRIKIKDWEDFYIGIIKHGYFDVSLEAGFTQVKVYGYFLSDEDGDQIVNGVNETISLVDQYYENVQDFAAITPNKLRERF